MQVGNLRGVVFGRLVDVVEADAFVDEAGDFDAMANLKNNKRDLIEGRAALLVIDDLWHSLGVAGFILLMVGGLLHTIGAIVYATRRPNPWPRWFGFHEVFHVFVIAAIAAHYVVVATIALPMAA